jgi:O-antigen ligase
MPIIIRIITYLTVFLFPALTNLVDHAGGAMVLLLLLFGSVTWLSRKAKPQFDNSEKLVLWSFAVYFLVSLVFYIGCGLLKEHLSLINLIIHFDIRHEFRLLGFIPAYYLFYRTGLKRWVLWHGTAVAAIISGVYGLIYIYILSAGERATGSCNPIAFGDISLLLGFISLSGIRYFYDKHKALIVIPILAVFCGMLSCFLSGTRIAFIATFFLTFIFSVQLGTFRRPWLYRSILIFSILLVSVIYYHLPGSPLEYRLQAGITDAKDFFHGKGSGYYAVHLSMWEEGWKIFKNHPLLGVGRTGYETIIKQKEAKNLISSEVAKYGSPHSMYLLNMTAFGISGLFILLAIFLFPLRFFICAIKAKTEAADIAYSGIILVVAFMIFGLTESIFNRNVNINIYTVLLAVIMTLTKQFEYTGKQNGVFRLE